MKSPYEYTPLPDDTPDPNQLKGKPKTKTNIRLWIFTILCIASFSIVYRLIVYSHLEQTSLMFIGLPTALALALTTTRPASSVTGRILKGMTMFFLLLGILAVEGFICILIASPLFYLIGAIIGGISDHMRKKEQHRNHFYSIAIVALLLSSLEGVNALLSFDREETVTIEETYPIGAEEVKSALKRGPNFDLEQLPVFLQLGFPLPQSIDGEGIELGDQWTIHFAGGEGEPGDLVVEVTATTANSIEFSNNSDQSHIAHWLHWRKIKWSWQASGETTSVAMEITYRRDLDPAWYFKPIERYGVTKAGEYFMQQTFDSQQP